jgi:hypothetical protein
MALPGFTEAARASAKAMSELYRGSRLLNAIVNDRGRFVIASMALYLHFGGERDAGGLLTAARLKALAVGQGVSSPGRAAAVIALMRWGGYLAPAPSVAGQRTERLIVTGKLMGTVTERLRIQLEAMSRFLPEAARLLARLEDPDFAAAFATAQAEGFVAGLRFTDHAPELDLFFERNGGFVLLLSLAAQGAGSDHLAPERVSISISALARRFGVSRPHVIALFRDAQAQGLLERSGDQLRFHEPLRCAIDRFYGLLFLLNLACGRRAEQVCAKAGRAG